LKIYLDMDGVLVDFLGHVEKCQFFRKNGKIDWDKVTTDRVNALIEVRVTPQRGRGFDEIAERIYKYPEVTATYLISGGFDLLVSIEGKSLREVSSFVSEKLSTLDSVISTATHFVLKKYKDHGTIMHEKYEDERIMVTP